MGQQHKVGTVHTAVQRQGDVVRVVYHSTAVVEAGPEGVRLNSGGWRTHTTKTRMNQASNQFNLGFHVFQTKGQWFVSQGETVVPFTDGMLL